MPGSISEAAKNLYKHVYPGKYKLSLEHFIQLNSQYPEPAGPQDRDHLERLRERKATLYYHVKEKGVGLPPKIAPDSSKSKMNPLTLEKWIGLYSELTGPSQSERHTQLKELRHKMHQDGVEGHGEPAQEGMQNSTRQGYWDTYQVVG